MAVSTLYEFYTQKGQALPSVAERSKIYESYGLGSATSYAGTAEQNVRLLSALQAGVAPTPTPTPTPTVTPTPTPTAISPAPSGGGMPSKSDINPATGKAYAVNPATGVWDDNYWATVVEPQLKTQYSGAGAVSAFQQPQVPQLEGLKKQYEEEVKLTEKQATADAKFGEITAVRDALKEREAEINENPFLSEASRVGRIRRLTEMANREVENLNLEWAKLQDEVTKANADVTVRLNLTTGQYSLNMQAYQTALSQFNTLLGMGAYDQATGNDIAQTSLSTGIPTSMIESAIAAYKEKQIQTTIQTIDDGTNITAIVMNTRTGEIISKQALGKSKPTTYKPTETEQLATIKADLIKEIQGGLTLADTFKLGIGFIDANTLLQLYNVYSVYGPARESPTELAKRYGISF